jgi:hypothetical protein
MYVIHIHIRKYLNNPHNARYHLKLHSIILIFPGDVYSISLPDLIVADVKVVIATILNGRLA